tara:strand:- start:2445 stop:3134 length:690 start_codon:yes stop_codon:yes gene_type:complete
MEKTLKSVDGPPKVDGTSLNKALKVWLPETEKYFFQYPFRANYKQIIGYNEFADSSQKCSLNSDSDCVRKTSYKYIRNTPLGYTACANLDGTIKTGTKTSPSLARGIVEDVEDLANLKIFGNSSEIDCIKLKGAIGIRMHDNSKYQKTEELANTANGWTIQEKCVEKTNFIKFNEGSELEYHIPIPDCVENFNTIYTNDNKNKTIIDIIQLTTIIIISIFLFRKIFSKH